jgi:pimeloyl-ACP methyl ester carboxylesterase
LRSAVLLGSEFGASVALAFAIQHPARVRGLVLCQPSGLLPSMPPKRFSVITGAVRRPARAILRRPAYTPAELEQIRVDSLEAQHALQCNQAALSVLALEDALRTGLAQGLCPTLLVLASRSRTYPLKPFQRFLEPMVSVTPMEKPGRPKLAVFPGRHSPLWEDPARIAQMLSGFAAATVPLDAHRHSWTLAAADWPARGMNQWLCTHPGCNAAQALPAEENPNRRTLVQ